MTSLLTMHVNEMMWLENRRITNNTIGAAGFVNICRRQESTEFRKGLRVQQQQHSLFSQESWGRLEMKPGRNKFKVQAH